LSRRSLSGSPVSRQLWAAAGICACLLLSGCPTASNPTRPQSTPASTPPPTSSSSSTAGTSGSSGASQPDAGSAASNAESPAPSAPGAPGTTGSAQGDGGDQGTQSEDTADGVGASTNAEPGSSNPGGSGRDPKSGDSGSVFAEGSGSDGVPDLRDEPSLEDAPAGAAGIPAATAADESTGRGGAPGAAGTELPGGASASAGETGAAAGATAGGAPGGGTGRPLTPAEQVAILDAQLEQGAGKFDTIILKTTEEQRQAAREQAAGQAAAEKAAATAGGAAGAAAAAPGAADSPYGDGVASGGAYSTGGGLGGASQGGDVPVNTAKYPPPADIPSGDDDDVVARQLREAAMREPDPAVRKKLWDEYRKYKGIKP